MRNPIRPTDNEARQLARELLLPARYGALGVCLPDGGAPMVSRVAMLWLGAPMLLLSDLALHMKALRADPRCSLLIGAPGAKGDPLIYPRITLQAEAQEVEKAAFRDEWLKAAPKTTLYYDFSDFHLLRLNVRQAFLNGGFGKAFQLGPEDLPLDI